MQRQSTPPLHLLPTKISMIPSKKHPKPCILPVQTLFPLQASNNTLKTSSCSLLTRHFRSYVHPTPITPPLPVDTQYSSFQADLPSSSETHQSSSVSGSSSAGAHDESVSNENFSEDKGDIEECSPAPTTARRTSIFKNLAPISKWPTLRLSLPLGCIDILSMGLVRVLNNTSNDSNRLYNTFPAAYSGPCNLANLIQLYGLQFDPLPFFRRRIQLRV